MKKKVVLNISGQKAISEEIEMEAVIHKDLARLAPKYPNTFGRADDSNSYAYKLINVTFDKNQSTVKLTCKDGARMALDMMLPWNQAEAEFAKINGAADVELTLAGTVGA